jgi:hypothetical protein
MSVDVASGQVGSVGVAAAVAAQASVIVTTADATNTRYDIVSSNASGTVVVTAGTPTSTPAWPTIPAGNAPLALITVTAGKTSIVDADLTDLRTILGPIGEGQVTGLTADLAAKAPITRAVNTVAASSTAQTIPDVPTAQISYITLTGNCTFTFPTAAAGKTFRVALKQDATGSRTATWPGTVKWSGGTTPTLTTAAAKTDAFEFTCYDGTNWIGQTLGLNF